MDFLSLFGAKPLSSRLMSIFIMNEKQDRNPTYHYAP